jgi:hypothetical protein
LFHNAYLITYSNYHHNTTPGLCIWPAMAVP